MLSSSPSPGHTAGAVAAGRARSGAWLPSVRVNRSNGGDVPRSTSGVRRRNSPLAGVAVVTREVPRPRTMKASDTQCDGENFRVGRVQRGPPGPPTPVSWASFRLDPDDTILTSHYDQSPSRPRRSKAWRARHPLGIASSSPNATGRAGRQDAERDRRGGPPLATSRACSVRVPGEEPDRRPHEGGPATTAIPGNLPDQHPTPVLPQPASTPPAASARSRPVHGRGRARPAARRPPRADCRAQVAGRKGTRRGRRPSRRPPRRRSTPAPRPPPTPATSRPRRPAGASGRSPGRAGADDPASSASATASPPSMTCSRPTGRPVPLERRYQGFGATRRSSASIKYARPRRRPARTGSFPRGHRLRPHRRGGQPDLAEFARAGPHEDLRRPEAGTIAVQP